ncbi:hypothetical protein [Burkholderia sp. A1]|uniref:hypothetical protein n=1 Tax=Burkholderia sp. A1 TaxID=148446 RepID=UPI001376D9DD|nr:hypothetical protein [Burkholderia sp. A1]
MTNPLLESFPAFSVPRVTARGNQAGTTDDDQLFVIVFVVMIFVETMARVSARAVMPCSLETGEIERFCAMRKSLHKPGGPYNGP